MTTNQDNKRVSDTYRDLAPETTPAGLDQRILAMAAHETRSRYGLARAWIRPIAWAATIALSLGIVLELTWLADAPVNEVASESAPTAEPARQDAEVMKAKQEEDLRRAIAERVDAPAESMPATSVWRDQERVGETAEAESRAADRLLLQDAGQRTRLEAASAIYGAAASSAAATDQDHACDREARASAEAWYDCILALREQGLDDAAAAELEALLQAFPDFQEPQSE
jgi:hypothetical protein